MKRYLLKHFTGVRPCALIFLLGLTVRLLGVFEKADFKAVAACEAVRIAISLAATGAYADAYGPGVGPTAHCAPLHPLFLSVLFRIFGTGAHGQMAMAVAASVASALAFALLPAVAAACDLPQSVGLLAGFAGALLPVNFWSQTSGAFDAPYAAAALTAMLIFVCRIQKTGLITGSRGVLFGLATGFCCLLNPSMLPVLVGWLVILLFKLRPQVRGIVGFCSTALACFLVTIAPWAIRNWLVLGSPVWSRSNFWLEMQVSNNDWLTADEEQNFRTDKFAWVHPYAGATERQKVKQIGEIAYMEQKRQQALTWISTHKRRFLELTAERFRLFWFPRFARRWQSFIEALISLLGIAGLITLSLNQQSIAWYLGAAIVFYPLPFYLIQVTPRFRLPLEPLLFFCSGYLCYRVAPASIRFLFIRRSSVSDAVASDY